MPKVSIVQNILAANDGIAQEIHQQLTARYSLNQYHEFTGYWQNDSARADDALIAR